MTRYHGGGGPLAAWLAGLGGAGLVVPVLMAWIGDGGTAGLGAVLVAAAAGCWTVITSRNRSALVAGSRLVIGFVALTVLMVLAMGGRLPVSLWGADAMCVTVGAVLVIASGSLIALGLGPLDAAPGEHHPVAR